jgi:malonyl-CoA/methylmalonyl-CoA synthetase
MNANLYALFESHFPAGPEKPCLLVRNGPVIHYDELAATSARIANALVRVGCKPGDRVAVQTDKVWQTIALYLACLRAGLVYLPLNTAYQKSELAFFFGDATPRVIVCRPEMLGVIATLDRKAHVLTLDANGGELVDRAQDESERFETVRSRPDDLAAILYTSGTTGRSKGAMLTHRNLASNAVALVEAWAFTEGDTLLHALPVFHVHGLFVATHCVLLSGAKMLWLPRFDAREVTEMLPAATVMMGVPTYYTRLLAEPSFTHERCAHVRLFVSGSAPLLPETFAAFEERIGRPILERYGMTETGMITSNPLDGARVAGTVGRPLAGVQARVVDSDAVCEPGCVGSVEVRGPNVFAGYWNLPDKTRDEFTPDGWFRTGDLFHVDADGFFYFTGRRGDMIKSAGANVSPREVEAAIADVTGLVAHVVGVDDAERGQVVAAALRVPGDQPVPDPDELRTALRTRLSAYKVPTRYLVLADDEVPMLSSGKLDARALRDLFG